MSKVGEVWCRLRFNFPFQGCQSVKARIESCYLATPFPSPLLPGQARGGRGGLCRVRLVFEACSAQQLVNIIESINQVTATAYPHILILHTHPPSTSSPSTSSHAEADALKLANPVKYPGWPGKTLKLSQNNPLRPKRGDVLPAKRYFYRRPVKGTRWWWDTNGILVWARNAEFARICQRPVSNIF